MTQWNQTTNYQAMAPVARNLNWLDEHMIDQLDRWAIEEAGDAINTITVTVIKPEHIDTLPIENENPVGE